MAQFRYRAATALGDLRQGTLEAANENDALARLRAQGLSPIEARPTRGRAAVAGGAKVDRGARDAAAQAVGELAVLLSAGLSLDRALGVVGENLANKGAAAAFATIHAGVKEGVPLSRAMADAGALFPPAAAAMAEAGEANGRLDIALTRLADTLDRAAQLRATIRASLTYPVILVVIATVVVLTMLLVVVPNFESLMTGQDARRLPAITRFVLGASRTLRQDGPLIAGALGAGGVALWQALRRPAARAAFDRLILRAPVLGPIVTNAETARFARVLGSLVDGGVPVPAALAIARRSLANGHMGAAVDRVAVGLKGGGGLTGPLIVSGVFPSIAISFLRTGEETARLGPMLERLADVLDREVRASIARALAVLTPAVTVVIGGVVGGVIASIMSAILGFNELAVGAT